MDYSFKQLTKLSLFYFSAYYHITKVIEASRIHLFDIVTQYRAIFSDDEPILITDGDNNTNYSNILHAWIGRKVLTEFHLPLTHF